jgi:hypothetical protein
MKPKKRKDIPAILADGTAIDAAVRAAAQDAVRQHRQAGQPLIVQRNGRIEEVDPWQIPLDEDTPSTTSQTEKDD